jgi:O-antigen ligase
VKNAATQSGEFVTCIFGLLFLASDAIEKRRWQWAFGSIAIILAMLANILYASTGRTALVVAAILLILFALKKLKRRSAVVVFGCAMLICGVGWMSSPYLRMRTEALWAEVQKYEATNERTSSGERIAFWTKSIAFVRQAPLIGHGTGSINALFEKAAAGQTGAAGVVAANPHNQTFAVAIQLGLIGVAVLWAMWIAHLVLFRGGGLAEWIGFVIVTQNIVGSLFNSHLFDFVQGWVYVIGVGVAGGMALKSRAEVKQNQC